MLIDLHAHSSGISRCCKQDARGIIEKALETGLDGIVLTNHYQECYVNNGDVDAFTAAYIEEYRHAKRIGDELGATVIFGIEVTLNCDNRLHMLVYGIDEKTLQENPLLYTLTPEQLYSLVHEKGGVVVQAHPYRNGSTVLDTNIIDGVELSCHPLYDGTHSEELIDIAKAAGIMITCGGDYHADTPYRPNCGVYLPDTVKDTHDLAEYIKTTDTAKLRVHELGQDTPDEHCHKIR